MNGPKHLCLDRDGAVLIADTENHLIRRYDPRSGSMTTIAGSGKGSHLVPEDPLKTGLNRPHGVFVHASGDLFISDSENHRVLRVKRVKTP
jgi:streptogramin lyase